MEQDLREEAEVAVVAGEWVVPVQVLVLQASVFVLSVGPLFLIGRVSLVIK